MNSQTAALSRQQQTATPSTTSPMAAAVSAISRLVARLRRWEQVQRNVELLSALDDRMLADIGLMRDQVWHVARLGRLPDWK